MQCVHLINIKAYSHVESVGLVYNIVSKMATIFLNGCSLTTFDHTSAHNVHRNAILVAIPSRFQGSKNALEQISKMKHKKRLTFSKIAVLQLGLVISLHG